MGATSRGASDYQRALSQALAAVFHLRCPQFESESTRALAWRLLWNPDVVPPALVKGDEYRRAEEAAVHVRQLTMGLIEGSTPVETVLDVDATEQPAAALELLQALQELQPDLQLPRLKPLEPMRRPWVPAVPLQIPLTLAMLLVPGRLPDEDRIYRELTRVLEGPGGQALEQAIRENAYLGPLLSTRDDALVVQMPRQPVLIQHPERRRGFTKKAARSAVVKKFRRADVGLEWVEPPAGEGYWIALVPADGGLQRYRLRPVPQGPGKKSRVAFERLL